MMGYDALESVLGKVASAYADACARHPVFPTRATICEPKKNDELLAFLQNEVNADDAGEKISVQSVLDEEVLEGIVALRDGNLAAARDEFLQVAAVAIRAYELCANMEAKKTDVK